MMSEKWGIFVGKTRLDSLNLESLIGSLKELRLKYSCIAIDLKHTRFVSLGAIQFIVSFADDLKATGGQLTLIAPAEKTKRHFAIYGSLDSIEIARSERDLPNPQGPISVPVLFPKVSGPTDAEL